MYKNMTYLDKLREMPQMAMVMVMVPRQCVVLVWKGHLGFRQDITSHLGFNYLSCAFQTKLGVAIYGTL